MPWKQSVNEQPESVLDLLIAQCGDLEKLLALAREEEHAAATRDFAAVMRVVDERATLGERLDVYHRQLAALRANLADASAETWWQTNAIQATALLTEIQTVDARTLPLLLSARNEIGHEQQRLERSQKGVVAYLQDGRMAVAYDQRV